MKGALLGLVVLAASGDARAASAVQTIATAIAKDLGTVPENALVIASPFTSDQGSIPKGDELSQKMAAAVAGKLGPTARAHGQPQLLNGARASAAKNGALIFLNVGIGLGQLRVTADVYPVVQNVWDRIRLPPPSPSGHAYSQAMIDPEVRSVLPPILLEQAKIRKVTHQERNVLAAACGDQDSDGGLELALLSRSRYTIGRIKKDGFYAEKTIDLAKIAPLSPVTLREPLATAAFGADGLLRIGTSDRLGVAGPNRLRGLPVPGIDDGCVALAPDASSFAANIITCDTEKLILKTALARFDAIAVANALRVDGTERRIVALRDPKTSRIALRVGDVDRKPIDSAGAQIAIADLDLDGDPEIAYSSDQVDDTVTIATIGDELRPRQRISVPGGVNALAACPPEANGVPGLVIVAMNEVWLVR